MAPFSVYQVNTSPSSAAYMRRWTGSSLVQVTPSHYLNQCWLIVNWTPGSIIKWNLNRNSIIFIQENAIWKCRLPKWRVWLGWVVHPNEQYSHGRDSLVGVLFSCILHHVLYCTIYLSRTITRLKMYLVISCGIKYKKISLSLSAFCILCNAGRFIPPRFSSLHSAPC